MTKGTMKARRKTREKPPESRGSHSSNDVKWVALLIKTASKEIVQEVKRALRQEQQRKEQSRMFPDYAESPFSQYMKWVEHLRNVPLTLTRKLAAARNHANRARYEEGKAHNVWNLKAETGIKLPLRRPHDWAARNEWRLALALMYEIEEAAARRWTAAAILAAKRKALDEIKLLRQGD